MTAERTELAAAGSRDRVPSALLRSSDVHVVIVTYNASGVITQLLTGLSKQAAGFETTLVDNNSTDTTIEEVDDALRRLESLRGSITVVHNKTNVGFARAINQVARTSRGMTSKVLLFVNPDAEIPEDLIESGLDVLSTRPAIAAASPVIRTRQGDIWWEGTRLFGTGEILRSRGLGVSVHVKRPGRFPGSNDVLPVEAVTGCSLFVRTDVFADLGGFDERFFMYGEDLDLSVRCRSAGYELVCFRTTEVVHGDPPGERALGEALLLSRSQLYWIESTGRFLAKHKPWLFALWLVKAFCLLPVTYVRRFGYGLGRQLGLGRARRRDQI